MQPDGAKGTTGASRRWWPRRGVDPHAEVWGVDLAGVYHAGVAGYHTMKDDERDVLLMTLFFKDRGMDLPVDWDDLLMTLLLE